MNKKTTPVPMTRDRYVMDPDGMTVKELTEDLRLHQEALESTGWVDLRIFLDTEEEPYDSTSYAKFGLQGQRPETEAETKRRVADGAVMEKNREEYERRQYEVLKKKFEKGEED